MNAQTLVLLVIIAALLVFALRHVYHNFVEGKHDCCGCDACSGHHDKEKNTVLLLMCQVKPLLLQWIRRKHNQIFLQI